MRFNHLISRSCKDMKKKNIAAALGLVATLLSGEVRANPNKETVTKENISSSFKAVRKEERNLVKVVAKGMLENCERVGVEVKENRAELSCNEKKVKIEYNDQKPFLSDLGKEPTLRATIDFWKKVEFELNENQMLAYDLRDEAVIYAHLETEKLEEGEELKRIKSLSEHYKAKLAQVYEELKKKGSLESIGEPKTEEDEIKNAVFKKAQEFKEDKFQKAIAFLEESSKSLKFKRGKKDHNLAAFKFSGRFREETKEILKKNGLPQDLVYLAAVESHFNPFTQSPAGAYGSWQFMKDTAKRYGLCVEGTIDERRDFFKSLEGTIKYLNEKVESYGNDDLAVLAYNQGNLVALAVRYAGTNNPAELLKILKKDRGKRKEARVVPRRFDDGYKYLLRMIAMKEGFEAWEKNPPIQADKAERRYYFPLIENVSSRELSECGLDVERVKSMNLEFLQGSRKANDFFEIVPVQSFEELLKGKDLVIPAGQVLRIPEEGKARFLEYYSQKEGGEVKVISYRVKEKDVLGKIAQAYHVRISDIEQQNARDLSRIFLNQELKIPIREDVTEESKREFMKAADLFNSAEHERMYGNIKAAREALEQLVNGNYGFSFKSKAQESLERMARRVAREEVYEEAANVRLEIDQEDEPKIEREEQSQIIPVYEPKIEKKEIAYQAEVSEEPREYSELNKDRRINSDPEKYQIDLANSQGFQVCYKRGDKIGVKGEQPYVFKGEGSKDKAVHCQDAEYLKKRVSKQFHKPVELEYESVKIALPVGAKIKFKEIR